MKQRRPWTWVELELLRLNYADCRTELLAQAIGRSLTTVYQKAGKLGLAKSQEYLDSPEACRLRREGEVGKAYRYPKGNVPANKGLRRPGYAPGNMASTWFKKGEMPHTWVPVGSYRINGDGWVEYKFSDEPGPCTRRWICVHRKVWIEANGPIPPGHIVVFKRGFRTTDPKAITADSVELITHAENMRRNSVHRFGPEVTRVVQLRGVLTRTINQRARAAT